MKKNKGEILKLCPVCGHELVFLPAVYPDLIRLKTGSCSLCSFSQPLCNLEDIDRKVMADWHLKKLLQTVGEGLQALEVFLKAWQEMHQSVDVMNLDIRLQNLLHGDTAPIIPLQKRLPPIPEAQAVLIEKELKRRRSHHVRPKTDQT
jgi:hypothetical protein